MREYPEEMQYTCKKDKVKQAKRTWKGKYKTIIERKELKDNYKNVERKYTSIKEVYQQTKILLEQTKTKLKNLHQEKETPEEVIKT